MSENERILRDMADACVRDIETSATYTCQSTMAGTYHSPICHAITELRTGVPQRFVTYSRYYGNLTPAERDKARMYHATHGAVLSEVPTSPAALVAYLKTNVLTPVTEAA